MENRGLKVEIVSPIDETSDVYGLLKHKGEGPYHICYRVEDLNGTIDGMKKDRWILVKPPAPAIALQNARVAFLFKKGVGLIELKEAGG